MKKTDVKNILKLAKRSTWSVDDFEWDEPLSKDLDKRSKELLGMAFLYISGIERLGASVFRIHSKNVNDEDAAELFELFAQDEERHADAELAMAKRLGYEWKDLPWTARRSFKLLQKDLESLLEKEIGRWIHNVNCSSIMFFEFGLDSVVLPVLKDMTNDKLQKKVWAKIDKDESRHLAMDYWLIENRYERNQERKENPVEGSLMSDIRLVGQKALLPAFIAARMVYLVPGFLPFVRVGMKLPMRREYFENYMKKVNQVPKSAPHAMEVKSYRVRASLIKRFLGRYSEEAVA